MILERDMEAEAIGVRVHAEANLEAKPRGEVIVEILLSIERGTLEEWVFDKNFRTRTGAANALACRLRTDSERQVDEGLSTY
jgi:hypothetical protein